MILWRLTFKNNHVITGWYWLYTNFLDAVFWLKHYFIIFNSPTEMIIGYSDKKIYNRVGLAR